MTLASVSENITFKVTEAGSGRAFALRLHRPGYNSLAELESERAWTAALAAAGIRVQEPVLTRSGEHFVAVSMGTAGPDRFAGMTRWVAGTPLCDRLGDCGGLATRHGAFRAIGRLAAAMHAQSDAWTPPPGFTRPVLDVDGLLGDSPLWGRFWEHGALSRGERDILLAARACLRERLEAYGQHRFGLIHADLHAENVLVDGDRVGVIDFDDAAFGWHAYDLATALVEQASAGDFAALRLALLEGYRELRELPDDDAAMLDDFLILRGLAIIGWFHQRPEHGASPYFDETRRRVLAQCRQRLGV